MADRISEAPGGLARLAERTTTSLPALKAYLEGEAEYRHGRYRSAVEALQRAVQADTGFALAYYRLSQAVSWTGEAWLSGIYSAAARRHAEGLGPKARALLYAWRAYLAGGAESAPMYRAILADDPADVEAWYQLGETLYHAGPQLGRPATDAAAPFRRVLAYEPGNIGALLHMVRITAIEGDRAPFDSLAARLLALQPAVEIAIEARALECRAMAAALPFAPTSAAGRRRLRRALAALTPVIGWPGPTARHIAFDSIYPPRRLYLLGLLGVRTDDEPAAACRSGRRPPPLPFRRVPRYITTSVEMRRETAQHQGARRV